MQYLLLVSILWAFSFSLIKGNLTDLDPLFATSIRLGLASLVFLPFLRLKKTNQSDSLKLIGCGAIQFGLMYVCYMRSYAYLPAHLVALFSILTPLYVIIIYNVRNRSYSLAPFIAAGISVAGAAVIKATTGNSNTLWIGFFLMQIAGLAFAYGQVFYRDWKQKHLSISDHNIFALLYLGGFIFASIASLFLGNFQKMNPTNSQWMTLLYLGIIASGIGFFFWNKGATISKAGTLAAFNNAVVPLAIIIAIFFFGEMKDINQTSLIRLLIGAGLIVFSLIFAEQINRNKIKAPKTNL